MKYKVLIPILLSAFVIVSWVSLFRGTYEKSDSYHQLLNQGDESYAKGLYQEAYGYYEQAYDINHDKDTEDKILASYQAFYEEQDTDETFSAYLDALYRSCERFPKETAYWENAVQASLDGEEYDSAMELCRKAAEEEVESDRLKELEHKTLYSYRLGGYGCAAFRNAVNGFFVTQTGTRPAFLASDGEDYMILDVTEVGCVGEEGIYLCKDLEGRIQFIDMDGIIRGKVDIDITDFGVYKEGFCSVKYNDQYCFIDLDGNILIEGLQYAGCFQDGKAVIQDQEGRWALIDREGKICSDYFEEIKVDYIGRYLFGDNIIAKKNEVYNIYNSSLDKEVKHLEASSVDIPVSDGLAAYCDNGKWGFIDSEGDIVIEPEYENARSFSGGFAGISQGDRWGFINQDNAVVVECQFYDVGYVSDEGACYVSDTTDYYELLKFNFADEIME